MDSILYTSASSSNIAKFHLKNLGPWTTEFALKHCEQVQLSVKGYIIFFSIICKEG